MDSCRPIRRLVVVGLLSVLVAVVAIVALLLTRSKAPPGNVGVTFAGFTNTGPSSAALFSFTNGTPLLVSIRLRSLEHQTSAGWQSQPFPMGHVTILYPGQATNMPFAVHTTNALWRVRALCHEHATGFKGVAHRSSALVEKMKTGQAVHRIGGNAYEILSSVPPP